MTIWCDGYGRIIGHSDDTPVNTHTHLIWRGRGPWGTPRAAHSLQSALPGPTSALPWPGRLVWPRPGRFVMPHHGRPVSRQGLGFPCGPRSTIRYSYRTNLVLFLRGREAPLLPRDHESHYESGEIATRWQR